MNANQRRTYAPKRYVRARRVSVESRNATERAIALVIAQWIAAGIDRDTDAEVLAVAGGRDR